MVALLGLDPATYKPSALHDPARTFPETNCYVDVWIELLHASGINPASALGFAFRVDFEGDQWTFFKPPSGELEALYGIDVHEMQLYLPTVEHAVEQLTAGRTLILEGDSFYLPDTFATSYRCAHVKSSIAIEAIDVANERLRYFHGPGYYELSGEDYRGFFRLGRRFSEDVLPPYVDLVRFDAGRRLSGDELRRVAHGLFRRPLQRPKRNPWTAFGERLSCDLPKLLAGTDTAYHAYAFATLRQCGGAFQSARSFVKWLADPQSVNTRIALGALERQVDGAKSLLFRLARRRPFDPAPVIEQLAEDWQTSVNALDRLSLFSDGGTP
jgi:hypothetical protein